MNTRLIAALSAIALVCSCQQTPYPLKKRPVVQVPDVTETPGEGVMFTGEVNTNGVNPLDIPGKKNPGYTNPYPAGSYEHFVAQPDYPVTMAVYCKEELLQNVTVTNSKIVICIPQQRARFYVNGKVAYDWPVSTGCNGHETPTGIFRIMDRQSSYHSQRYGKYVKNGKVISSNADTSKGIPSGATFQGSSMPHWNRLTWDGVGIHGGRVVAGKRLSHGCIRTPFDVAKKLFNYTRKDLPVYITRAVEDYNRGGAVKPIDVKYRPKPGNDYTDMAPEQYQQAPAN